MADSPKRSLLQRLTSHIPPEQFARYLCVGVFNTVFGYSIFALLNWFLHRHGLPAAYMYAYILSNFISITVAYFGYKLFVFKTQGNYLREWLKAMAVYWSGILPGLVLIPALVYLLIWVLPTQILLLHHAFSSKDASPYIATAILTVFGVFYNFLGHKHVTFRQRPPQNIAQPTP